jgi:hypothetical protein
MKTRIIFGYFGAILFPIVLLPLAAFQTMNGHSLLYLGIFGSPVGFLGCIAYSDVRRRFSWKAILIRTFAALIIVVAFVLVIAQIKISPFFINKGWILIVLVGPMLSAWATEFMLKKMDGA